MVKHDTNTLVYQYTKLLIHQYTFTDIKNIFDHAPGQNILNFILKS